jgi:hypothetical protein
LTTEKYTDGDPDVLQCAEKGAKTEHKVRIREMERRQRYSGYGQTQEVVSEKATLKVANLGSWEKPVSRGQLFLMKHDLFVIILSQEKVINSDESMSA